MASTELPQPGISVIQKFRTISPTIVSPTLVPCVAGVCKQIVEALATDATGNTLVNTEAAAEVPPIVTSESAEDYQNLDGLTLKVSVKGGPEQEVVFSDPTSAGLTAAQVRSQILATSGLSGWTPYVVARGSANYLQLQGDNAGDGQSLQILDGDANGDLGFNDFQTAYGFSSYNQDKLFVAQNNFPDPRENIDELNVDESTIRVFMVPSGSSTVEEAKQDETFLRNGYVAWVKGSAVSFPTASMITKTLLLTLVKGGSQQTVTFGGDFYGMEGTLVVPGSAYSDPGTDAIQLQKDTDSPVTVTFASPADIAAAVTAINAAWAGTYSGEDVCYRADSDGVASGSGTFIAFQVGGATATGEAVKVIEGGAGDAFADIGFVTSSGFMSSSLVLEINTALNASSPELNAADGGSDLLQLLSYSGYILVDKDGTANTTLGLPTASDTTQYAIEGVDDGDGDTKSDLVRIHNEDFSLDATSASMTGTADLSGDQQVHKLTFQASIDGEPMQEIEFNGGFIVASSAAGAFPGSWNAQTLNLLVNGTAKTVTFSSPADLDDVVNQINTDAGQPVCYRSTNAGVANAAGTYLSFQVGGATDAGGEIVLVYASSTAWTNVGLSGTANIYQTLTSTEIEAAIEATLGTGAASIVSDALVMASATYGDESKIKIGQGTANSVLGFTDLQIERGRAFKPKAGDDLYAEGTRIGQIVQVSPGAVVTDLRLDTKLSFADWKKLSWYIQALEIASPLPTDRPTPDLVVDLAGDITIKADILRDNRGVPVHEVGSGTTVADTLLITYEALRLDVTGRAESAALLTFEDTDELESTLSPIGPDNPLALGLYFALLNAPGVTVSGIGVDEFSSSKPYGTLAGHTRAATFLESEEVYALAPLTHDADIHQMWLTHVDNMSEPDARGERYLFACPDLPERELDTLVASGTDGDTTGTTNEFDTKVSNLASLLNSAGIDPQNITVDDGVFLDIASDNKSYNLSSVSGTVAVVNVTFAPGENDDGFYSTANLATPLISESFSVKIRGAELLDADGDPDNAAIAETLGDLGRSYANRRMSLVVPDLCAATIGSLEQQIPSFYVAAALSGMTGQQRPQQGFTNFPITGFTQVIGSNDRFSQTQMNVASGGGVWWIIQEVEGGPLTTRHQLSTDVSSVEKREYSITRVVDFTAKLMRAGLRNFIGKFNITQGFLDTLSTTIQGQLSFLQENGVIIGGDLNNIVQDTDNPDTVLIDVTLDVPYPCNYIRLTLVV